MQERGDLRAFGVRQQAELGAAGRRHFAGVRMIQREHARAERLMEQFADRLALQRTDDVIGAVAHRLVVGRDRIGRRLAGIVDAHLRPALGVVGEIRGEEAVANRLRHAGQLCAERQQQRDILQRLVAFGLQRAVLVRTDRADRLARTRQIAREYLALAAQGLFHPRAHRIAGRQCVHAGLQRVRIGGAERIDELLAILFAIGAVQITIELRACTRRRERIAASEIGARAQFQRAYAQAGRRLLAHREQALRLRDIAMLERDFRIEQIEPCRFLAVQAATLEIAECTRGAFQIAALAQRFRCAQTVVGGFVAATARGEIKKCSRRLIEVAVLIELLGVIDVDRRMRRNRRFRHRHAGRQRQRQEQRRRDAQSCASDQSVQHPVRAAWHRGSSALDGKAAMIADRARRSCDRSRVSRPRERGDRDERQSRTAVDRGDADRQSG